MKRLDEKGLTLLDMCLTILILGLISQSMVLSLMVLTRKIVALQDRSYAAMKAQQMFNELEAYANGNPYTGGMILNGYNDNSQYNLILTADKQVSLPGDPLSDNRQENGHWRYLRQIQVSPAAGNPQARQVAVKVWKCASDGNPMVPGILLTTTVGTVIPGAPATYSQTPNIYIIH